MNWSDWIKCTPKIGWVQILLGDIEILRNGTFGLTSLMLVNA